MHTGIGSGTNDGGLGQVLTESSCALLRELRLHELNGGLLQIQLRSGVLTEVRQGEGGVVDHSTVSGGELMSQQLEKSGLSYRGKQGGTERGEMSE